MTDQSLIDKIEAILPQTQCQQCGFKGCRPYAEAIAQGKASINQCPPGGKEVLQDLAQLLDINHSTLLLPEKYQQPKSIAWIDESLCIGCTACIKACPVDAIIGSTKYMHTVLSDECTGCELCLPPCPLDCIHMNPVTETWLPKSQQFVTIGQHAHPRQIASNHAKQRHTRRKTRLDRIRQTKTSSSPTQQHTTHTASTHIQINTANLIAQAMDKAKAIQNKLVTLHNQKEFSQQQIQKAQRQAQLRNHQRIVQYGLTKEKESLSINTNPYSKEDNQP